MNKLYLQAASDTSKGLVTMAGSKNIVVKILWGSEEDPKKAAVLLVTWPHGTDQPKVSSEIYEAVSI
jgi:hypothetical protein